MCSLGGTPKDHFREGLAQQCVCQACAALRVDRWALLLHGEGSPPGTTVVKPVTVVLHAHSVGVVAPPGSFADWPPANLCMLCGLLG